MLSENKNETSQLVGHLFRREFGRITSVLTGILGLEHIELAEDVVQDTLYKALQQWPYSGIPGNPSAWLYSVAKNKAIDILRKENLKYKYADKISPGLNQERTQSDSFNEHFSENEIKDDLLRMIFTCCHPQLPVESQIAFALKTLCGFSIKEIATAFLSNEATINKRIYRTKEIIREGKIKFEIPPVGNQLGDRLQSVLSTIYLLFNEGYNSHTPDILIRNDLIEESIRLAELLAEHHLTAKPEVNALLALMFFHYARTPARVDNDDNIVLLENQNRSLWNKRLIDAGIKYFKKASTGYQLSQYHLEAGIAYLYVTSKDFDSIDWKKILMLYKLLYNIKETPVVGLNRAIVYSRINGAKSAIKEIEKTKDIDTLEGYYLYHSTLADLYFKCNDKEKALFQYEKAISLTISNAEKKLLNKKIKLLKNSHN